VGDTVTIQIVENVTASQKSSSTANRTSSMSGQRQRPSLRSRRPGLGQAGVGTSSANDFSGKGATESANTFSGSITATVVDVLPNGHLVVAGEKQIGVNQNVDVLRFSGTVDPRADAARQHRQLHPGGQRAHGIRGRGAQAEAQTVGWINPVLFQLSTVLKLPE
jgi:flagellar L-ring protein precursor FlgH